MPEAKKISLVSCKKTFCFGRDLPRRQRVWPRYRAEVVRIGLLTLTVGNFDDIEAITAALEPESWHLIPPELTHKDNQRTFVKVVKEKRFTHFHLMLNKGGEVARHLSFRDRLRQNLSLANEYAQLKQTLPKNLRTAGKGIPMLKVNLLMLPCMPDNGVNFIKMI